METTTPFELNQAIQRWRENLGHSPAFRRENLDELESHLRDSTATLQTRGLNAEEAFLVAAKRIGKGASLAPEFGKVNGQAVWIDRFFWILIAFQTWTLIVTASAIAVAVAFALATLINDVLPGFGLRKIAEDSLRMAFGLALSPWITALLAAIGWWLFIRPKERVRAFFRRFLLLPGTLAVTLFISCVILQATSIWALYHYYWSGQAAAQFNMRYLAYHLPQFALLAVLTLFVAHKRLRTSQA